VIEYGVSGAHRVRTFAELAKASNRLANALVGIGVARGERVGLLVPQSFTTTHDCAALDVDDGDRSGCESIVGDAARLDRDHARVAVDGARIPEGEDDEPCTAQGQVRLEDALARLCVLH
jgi:hypothetical protein